MNNCDMCGGYMPDGECYRCPPDDVRDEARREDIEETLNILAELHDNLVEAEAVGDNELAEKIRDDIAFGERKLKELEE